MATLWYKKKWVIVLLHTAVWLLVFLLPLLLSQSIQHSHKAHVEFDRTLFVYLTIFSDIIFIILFYFNAFVLIPKFIYSRKLSYYVLVQLIIIAVLAVLQWLFSTFIIKIPFYISGFVIFNIFPYFFILAC